MRNARAVLVVSVTVITAGLVGSAGIAGASAVRLKKPGAPTNLAITPTNTALSVSWSAPASTGGAPITGYTVTAQRKGQPTETCSTTTATTCVVSGLANPTDKQKNIYAVEVTATNSVGTGAAARGHAAPSAAQNCSYLGPYANLQGCSLTRFDFYGLDLDHANLTGDDLTHPEGSIALTEVNFTDAILTGTNLNPTDFDLDNLTGADFSNANMGGSAILESNITNTIFAGATFGAILSFEDTGAPASLPTNWELQPGGPANPKYSEGAYLVGPGVKLQGANLQEANLFGADLAGSDLAQDVFAPAGATLAGATLTDANLVGADLAGVDLENADLGQLILPPPSHITFPGADLSGANLSGADLTGADFSGVDLSGVTWSNTTCPDGTNSGSGAGATCFGHLIP